ncbi:MAG: hypothetical protein J0M15_01505 [Deltaproteobacteria bacterium]|nr:hypothetical protein [Deltaproteobacteria bacterium]
MIKNLLLLISVFIFGTASLTPAMADESCPLFYQASPPPPPPPPMSAVEKVVNYIKGLFRKKQKPVQATPHRPQNTVQRPQGESKQSLQEQSSVKKSPPPPEEKQDGLKEKRNEEYKAKNKDISEAMKKPHSSYLFGTTAPVPEKRVREEIFDTFDDDGWRKDPSARTTEVNTTSSPPLPGKRHQSVLVNPLAASTAVVPVAYGSMPVVKTYTDFRVFQPAMGEYLVESLNGKPLPEKMILELETSKGKHLSEIQKTILTKKSKIRQNQWPAHILDGVKKAQDNSGGDIAAISEILSSWITTDGPYKYFSENGQKPADTILEMAVMKEFNCDGGAQIGATLLRDFFGIPTRIVDGRRTSGKKDIDGQNYNVADYSLPRHAWVEVFIGDEWVSYDFTPTRKNPELEKNNKEELEEENEVEETPEQQTQQTKEQKPPLPPKDQKKAAQNLLEMPEKEKPKDLAKPPPKPKYSKVPPGYKTPLGLLVRQMLLNTLGPVVRLIKWNGLEALLDGYLINHHALTMQNKKAKSDLQTLTSRMYGMKEGTLVELLTEAKAQIHSDPTISYRYLKAVKDFISEIGNLRELTVNEQRLHDELVSIMHDFSKLNHPSAKEQALTQSVLKGLPGEIIKEIIRDQFPKVEEAGSVDQKAFVTALRNGGLNNIMQASLVGKHFNFLLNAEREHKLRYAKSILRAYTLKNRNEDIVLARPEDVAKFERWILDIQYNPDPVLMLLDNLLKDQQYMMGYRQQYPTAGSQSTIERKHTNIFFDISGSMHGRPAEVQASAIAAIVDKALSEKDPFGNHTHKVIIFPFGNEVHAGIQVTTAAEAKREVLNYLSRPTVANDGTNIQACFDTHFKMIKDSIKASNPSSTDFSQRLKLNRANMILLTDGGASVNKQETINEINALPSYVKTMFNLVALGGRNSTLEEIVQYTNTKNSKSMVTEITAEMMENFAKDAKKVDFDPEAFVFDPSIGSLGHGIISRINNLRIPDKEESVPGNDLAHLVSLMKRKQDSPNNPMLISELLEVESVLLNSTIGDDIKIGFVTELLKNFLQLGGNDLSELSVVEFSQLTKIIRIVKP